MGGGSVIQIEWAREFAREWIAAWNDGDLERILAHYADDFEMTSPLIIERMGVASGMLREECNPALLVARPGRAAGLEV